MQRVRGLTYEELKRLQAWEVTNQRRTQVLAAIARAIERARNDTAGAARPPPVAPRAPDGKEAVPRRRID